MKRFLALCGFAFVAQTAALLSSPVSVPLFADDGTGKTGTYTVYFTTGTPPQNFNLTVDTNAPDIFLLSKDYHATRSDCDVPQGRRHLYDSSRSSSAQRLRDDFGITLQLPYMDVSCKTQEYAGFYGKMTTENIQLCDGFFGPACVNPTPSTRLNLSVVAQVEGQLSPNWHSDGIFGLAFDASYDNVDEDQPSSLTKILNTFQDPQVTLFLKRTPSGSRNIAGQLTLGGVDSTNCGSDWYELLGMDGDVTCDSYWCLSMYSITFGATSTQIYGVVSIDTSTAMSYVGAPLLNTMADALNAEYNASSDAWTVSCDLIGKAPDLVMHMDGEGSSKGDIRISSVDYIVPLPSDTKRCQLLFSSSGITDDQSWTIGTTLLKSHCIRYNLNVYRHVFFAKALQ
ncbi:Protein ASP-1 protein7 [Aphelenchoides avenae]|nr:Protein ASP-1 protein7 [Aphelenchus avenae]